MLRQQLQPTPLRLPLAELQEPLKNIPESLRRGLKERGVKLGDLDRVRARIVQNINTGIRQARKVVKKRAPEFSSPHTSVISLRKR